MVATSSRGRGRLPVSRRTKSSGYARSRHARFSEIAPAFWQRARGLAGGERSAVGGKRLAKGEAGFSIYDLRLPIFPAREVCGCYFTGQISDFWRFSLSVFPLSAFCFLVFLDASSPPPPSPALPDRRRADGRADLFRHRVWPVGLWHHANLVHPGHERRRPGAGPALAGQDSVSGPGQNTAQRSDGTPPNGDSPGCWPPARFAFCCIAWSAPGTRARFISPTNGILSIAPPFPGCRTVMIRRPVGRRFGSIWVWPACSGRCATGC